jgi:hypothetical protein
MLALVKSGKKEVGVSMVIEIERDGDEGQGNQ